MFPELTLKLVQIFEAYFPMEELRELAALFEVEVEAFRGYQPEGSAVARGITEHAVWE